MSQGISAARIVETASSRKVREIITEHLREKNIVFIYLEKKGNRSFRTPCCFLEGSGFGLHDFVFFLLRLRFVFASPLRFFLLNDVPSLSFLRFVRRSSCSYGTRCRLGAVLGGGADCLFPTHVSYAAFSCVSYKDGHAIKH